MDPCETPNNISSQELYVELIFILCFLFIHEAITEQEEHVGTFLYKFLLNSA